MALKNAFGQLALEHADENGYAHLVTGTKKRWRREFTDSTLAAWDVVTGAGMAVTAGNGTLTVTTGTTINSTTTITSKETFQAPFKAQLPMKISQKIVNQEFYAEVIACDANTGVVDETVVAAWRIAGSDSVTTTVARAETRNGGATRSQSGNLTVGTQTADNIYEIVVQSDEVEFHNKPVDSTAARGGSAVRNSVAPDPNRLFKLRFRIVNAATAPASTTTFTSQFATAIDYSEINVEITGGPGHSLPSSAMPVNVQGGSIGMTSTTLAPNTGAAGTSVSKVLSAASTNATLIKNTVARLYGYHFVNTSAAMKYVRLYNLTVAPTVGTSVPFMVIPIPGGQSVDIAHPHPIAFGTGLSYAITGSFADLDATAVAAGEVIGHIVWA
jgi:hypothetical protein